MWISLVSSPDTSIDPTPETVYNLGFITSSTKSDISLLSSEP